MPTAPAAARSTALADDVGRGRNSEATWDEQPPVSTAQGVHVGLEVWGASRVARGPSFMRRGRVRKSAQKQLYVLFVPSAFLKQLSLSQPKKEMMKNDEIILR